MKNDDVAAQAKTNWTTLCYCLEERIAKYNAEKGDVRLVLEKGQVLGRVSVAAVGGGGVITRLGFEMTMNTGGLRAWFQERMTRHSGLPIVTTVEDDRLVVRYGKEPVTMEELVARALARWQTRYSPEVRWSFTGD